MILIFLICSQEQESLPVAIEGWGDDGDKETLMEKKQQTKAPSFISGLLLKKESV